jgi:hypothetical protein
MDNHKPMRMIVTDNPMLLANRPEESPRDAIEAMRARKG